MRCNWFCVDDVWLLCLFCYLVWCLRVCCFCCNVGVVLGCVVFLVEFVFVVLLYVVLSWLCRCFEFGVVCDCGLLLLCFVFGQAPVLMCCCVGCVSVVVFKIVWLFVW